jgi:hypothetical protein
MNDIHHFVAKIAGKFGFSSSGKVYYWDSYEPNAQMGLIKSIYPIPMLAVANLRMLRSTEPRSLVKQI